MLKNNRNQFISNNSTTASYRGVTLDDSYIYGTTSSNVFIKWDLKTGTEINGPSFPSVVLNSCAVTLITPATACVFSSNSSQVDYIDINTNAKTSVTTNATTLSSQFVNQQVDSANGIALACRSSAGGLLRATASGGLTNMTVSALSGVNAVSILANSASGVWFVGTNDGRIITVNQFGTLLNTISIPKTPSITQPTTLKVCGLSFYDPYIVCCTNLGNMYLYNYWTGSEIDRALNDIETGSNTYPSMCPSKNGFTVTHSNVTNTANVASIDIVYFGSGRIIKQTEIIESQNSLIGCALSSSNVLVWDSHSSLFQLRSYDINPISLVSVSTEAQNPPGTPVTSRIIRIIDFGIGKKQVFSDNTIPATETLLPAISNCDYIELAIRNSNEWDIREFTG